MYCALFDKEGNKAAQARIAWIHGRGEFPCTGFGGTRRSDSGYGNIDAAERDEIFMAVRGLYVVTVFKLAAGETKHEEITAPDFFERLVCSLELALAGARRDAERGWTERK